MSQETIEEKSLQLMPHAGCLQWEKELIGDIAIRQKDINIGKVSCRNVHRKTRTAFSFVIGILIVALLTYLLTFFYSCYNHTVCIYEFENNKFMKVLYYLCKSLGRKESTPI